MKVYKRFIGAGMYVKREDDSYWLGHYCTKNDVVRTRISKEVYEGLLRNNAAMPRKARA